MAFSQSERNESFASLGRETCDLAIVGGGINGAGIARDAAMRGLSVVLVEKGDFASGTSSRSSRLIHGGIRYLEQLEIHLVFEATNERTVLARIAPHLARPLPFLVPVFTGAKHGMLALAAGLWIYDGLSLFRSYRLHKTLSTKKVLEIEPGLRTDGLKGAALFWDRATDDARLTLENAIAAHRAGARVMNYVEVVGFRRGEGDRVSGLVLSDRLGGGRTELSARLTIVAAGPWLDGVLDRLQPAGEARPSLLRPTKGVHIVVPADRLPVHHAIVANAISDGRVLFFLPWGAFTIVGTTDTDYQGPPEEVAADGADARYLLETANHYMPGANLVLGDVVSTWAGLRPLVRQEGVAESQVSREHEILEPAPGLLAIAGGKLTTYRRMAEEIVDKAVAQLGAEASPCRTDKDPLPGAPAWEDWDEREGSAEEKVLLEEHRLDPETAAHLLTAYGARALEIARLPGGTERITPSRPDVWAEVDFAVEEEMAVRLEDFLLRRTDLLHKGPDQSLGLARPIAERMGRTLGWDAARVDEEVRLYERRVALHRRFREG